MRSPGLTQSQGDVECLRRLDLRREGRAVRSIFKLSGDVGQKSHISSAFDGECEGALLFRVQLRAFL